MVALTISIIIHTQDGVKGWNIGKERLPILTTLSVTRIHDTNWHNRYYVHDISMSQTKFSFGVNVIYVINFGNITPYMNRNVSVTLAFVVPYTVVYPLSTVSEI